MSSGYRSPSVSTSFWMNLPSWLQMQFRLRRTAKAVRSSSRLSARCGKVARIENSAALVRSRISCTTAMNSVSFSR
ncbi:hypothetical protein D9M72_625160 [compost metagenome]